ncbi:hypothetical protein [Salmonella enterica]|uniref:hypothetical protein n=1 Tax=Salmonella enterica TaxID=28901 RepID=UPI002238D4AF|nr:hypothetical protein [Salmonella enterica]MCW6831726.1 hypothetical protein [Salmonella enterica]
MDKPANHSKEWTNLDNTNLKLLVETNKSFVEISNTMQRTLAATITQAQRLNLIHVQDVGGEIRSKIVYRISYLESIPWSNFK